VDILRGLLTGSDLSSAQEAELFALLQSKATAELDTWIGANFSDAKLAKWLKALPTLAGGTEVLAQAKKSLVGAPKQVIDALSQLEQIVDALTAQTNQQVTIYLDLGDIPGFGYHTGVVFAAYKQGYGKALGNGGRYDNIGEAFGRARTATGFAFDLKSLVANGQFNQQSQSGIFVPEPADFKCRDKITALRQQGERVVQGFSGQVVDFQEINCDRQLILKDGQYLIEKLV
jgi:ATP phosphoribosyltransferase regulatory subunit